MQVKVDGAFRHVTFLGMNRRQVFTLIHVDELFGALGGLAALRVGPFEIVDSLDALRLLTSKATRLGAVVKLLALLSHDQTGLHHGLLHLLFLSGFAKLITTFYLGLFLFVCSDQLLMATKPTVIFN